MRRWAIINVLMGLIVALLAIQIVSTWARSLPKLEERQRQPAPPPAEPRETKGRRSAEKAPATPDAVVTAVTEKDLFDPSRRPLPEDGGPAAVAQEAAPLPPPSGVAIVGIRLLHGEREAFIQDATQANKQRRLRVGDQLQNYTVKEITDAQVILAAPTGQSVTMDVELKKSGGGRGPAPGTPGRPQAAGVGATTITIPRPTTTSTTRPPGARPGLRSPGAKLDMPSLNKSVEKKLEEIRKRGSDAREPVRGRLLAAGHGDVTRRNS